MKKATWLDTEEARAFREENCRKLEEKLPAIQEKATRAAKRRASKSNGSANRIDSVSVEEFFEAHTRAEIAECDRDRQHAQEYKRRKKAADATNKKRSLEAEALACRYMKKWAELWVAASMPRIGEIDAAACRAFKGKERRYESTVRKWRKKYAVELASYLESERQRIGSSWE